MVNKEKAIGPFLERVQRFPQLPLITDSKMDWLFGGKAVQALADMDRYNREEQLCLHCNSRCCRAVRCEFYAPEFGQCPIYDFRPVVCRLYFCHRFNIPGDSLVEELGGFFLESLMAADRQGSSKARLFDNPPLSRSCPELIAETSSWMNAVREGSLNPQFAVKLIGEAVEKYRIARMGDAMSILKKAKEPE